MECPFTSSPMPEDPSHLDVLIDMCFEIATTLELTLEHNEPEDPMMNWTIENAIDFIDKHWKAYCTRVLQTDAGQK